MFEKTLTDVVRGIRASKRDTALYISACIAEIKQEIASNDMSVKANALQKLTFLQMMGCTCGLKPSWCWLIPSLPSFS
jgi:AP-3 complex subunit delta